MPHAQQDPTQSKMTPRVICVPGALYSIRATAADKLPLQGSLLYQGPLQAKVAA